MIKKMKTCIVIIGLISMFLILPFLSSAAGSDLPPVAGIECSGSNSYKVAAFTLKENKILRLKAIGTGSRSGMLDFGCIENCRNGQLVWVMHLLSSEPDAENHNHRKADRLLPLRAGSYRLHFKTDSYKNSYNPGIWLFDETANHKKLLKNFWKKADCPDDYGWSGNRLNKLGRELEEFGTDALMLITDNRVIFEYGNTTNIIRSHSMRKSMLSALYGTYTSKKDININSTLQQLDITESVPLTQEEKQATVLDLLKARSGIYIPAAAEVPSMRKARPQRGEHRPGDFWYYNNWDFNVLGTIFRRETGHDIYQAFKKRIADPVGMQDFMLNRQAYRYERNYSIHPAYPFLISARDMAKFGQLFLQQGRWNKKQVIPEDWIAASIKSYSKTGRHGIGYGYMWWVVTETIYGMQKGSYFASGYGGQKLYILPRINSIVVHRVNIDVPGTDVTIGGMATYAVIKKIMKAYTGKKGTSGESLFRESNQVVPEKRLLDKYGRSSKYYGRSFHHFRSCLWICAVILISGLVIWPIFYIMRKHSRLTHAGKKDTIKSSFFSCLMKWTAASGGFICSLYIYIILTTSNIFEYIAIVGIPGNLKLHQQILAHVPKFGVFFILFLLICNRFVWTEKYWTIQERTHFSLITLAAAGFISIAFNLNLVVLL